jgi:hypothetical protein
MNIEQARFNMIEQQIRPWDVLDKGVLGLLAIVRREDFVPARLPRAATPGEENGGEVKITSEVNHDCRSRRLAGNGRQRPDAAHAGRA